MMSPAIAWKAVQRVKASTGLAITLLACVHGSLAAQEVKPPLTAEEVVSRMVAMSERRNEALRSYSSVRGYTIDFSGIKHLHAEMVVSMNYQWPNKKELTIVSESGSGTLRHHALKPLLEAELESMKPENQQQSAISPENYSFELVGYTKTDSGECYILEVHPRHKNKFLFKGKVWVEAKGFAITRIVGQPAVNPSWWTKETDFERAYTQVDGFWLPISNQSLTLVRIFGQAQLTIDYKEYQLKETRRFEPIPHADSSSVVSMQHSSPDRRSSCVSDCKASR